MANVILKSFKFTKLLNRRLPFSSMKLYVNGQSYKQTRQTNAYATAAYKLEPNEDLNVKYSVPVPSTITNDIHSINEALNKIDSAIRRCGRTQMKNIFQTFSLITSKEMTTSTHGLYLIRCCKHCFDEPPSKRIEMVSQIWNKYQELGVEFDVKHFNALLDVYISNGHDFNPAEILASMEEDNIQPNKTTYLTVMKKYCQDGNIEGASEILEHMKKEGLSADEKVFNYLIEGHIKNNDFAGAKDMLEVMRSSNLQPNADTHTIFACGYAAIGEKNKMMSSLKECGNETGAENYLKVVDVLATSGYHEYIDEVLSLIKPKEQYSQEFINASVGLIYKDQLDVAFKLAKAACSAEYNESTNIFIKQLMRGEKPVSKVVHYCQCFEDEGLNNSTYFIASRIASDNAQLDYAVAFFQKMLKKGHYVRASNFWPMFKSLKVQKSPNEAWIILKKMSEFGIPADMATYLDNLYPLLGVPEPDDVLYNIKASNQVLEVAADALFVHYCNLGEVDHADRLIQLIPVRIRKLDIEAFLNRCDSLNKDGFNTFLKLLKYMLKDVNNNADHSVLQGKLLADLLLKRPRILDTLLKRYEDLSFSNKALIVLEEEILKRNSSRKPLVQKLRHVSLEREMLFGKENLSNSEEEKCIDHLKSQGIPCEYFLQKRISHHIKHKNITRVSKLVTLFEEMNLNYSPLMLTHLMSIYCNAGEIEKALQFFNKLSTEFPSFKLDVVRSLEVVISLLKYEKYDESFETMTNLLSEPYIYNNKESVFRAVRRFNIVLCDNNNVEFVKKMQDLLLPLSEEIGSKKAFLDSRINYHLQRNDLTSAVEEFRSIVMKHRIPACLSQLLKKCIMLDDKSNLQKVIDVAVSCTRKSVVLLELAVVFINLYNTQKAAQIIESIRREIFSKDLDDICLKLSSLNKVAELEELIRITKCVDHIDREALYIHAIRACASRNDIERAKKLFHTLKGEIATLKPETISFFEDLTKIKNESGLQTPLSKLPSENIPAVTEATKSFIQHLEEGDAEAALSELSTLKKGYIRSLSLKTLTDLIDLCLQKDCTNDLSLNVQAMSYIIDNAKDVLKPIVEKYSEAGDVEKFVAISAFIPDFSLMSMQFNLYFGKAFINGGKHEELLSQLEQRVDKKNKLFSALAFEELLKFPQYEDRIYNLAVKYQESAYTHPMAVVWAHYFIQGNYEKANEIFKEHQVSIEKNESVLNNIKKNENITLALKYVDFVKDLTIRTRVKERAYGVAVNLLVAKGMYDEAVSLVVESEKLDLGLHKYYMKPLMTLKSALEKENKPVPFSIPQDVASDSSSDSD